jgi:putative transcriptional regulator
MRKYGAMETLRGKLLIAGPTLLDPNFARSVVLVGEHNDEGALGVILNRRSDTPVAEAVPDLAELVDVDAAVHVGGPVQPSAVLVLAEFEDPGEASQLVVEDVGFLAVDDDEPSTAPLRRARVFAGYAGWGPGQLETELSRDDWIIAPSRADDVFDEDPESMWSRVLDRKGGQYRLVARMPLDPSVN